MIYEPAAWDVLARSVEATTEPGENFLERVKQPPFHRARAFRAQEPAAGRGFGREFHRHPRRSGEHALSARSTREPCTTCWTPARCQGEGEPLRRRPGDASSPCRRPRRSGRSDTGCPSSSIFRIRSGFASRRRMRTTWWKARQTDETWSLLADRRHGPWRGLQTDFFPPARLSRVRLRGVFSNGRPFHVEDVRVFRGQ